MSKPRICEVSMLNPEHEMSPFRAPSANKAPTGGPVYEKVRMIEYSAYQTLLEQANAMAEAISKHHDGWNEGGDCMGECSKLCKALAAWQSFKSSLEKGG